MVSASQKRRSGIGESPEKDKIIMGMERLPYKERQQRSRMVQHGEVEDVGRLTVSWR